VPDDVEVDGSQFSLTAQPAEPIAVQLWPDWSTEAIYQATYEFAVLEADVHMRDLTST
jgi:hypothetical protein